MLPPLKNYFFKTRKLDYFFEFEFIESQNNRVRVCDNPDVAPSSNSLPHLQQKHRIAKVVISDEITFQSSYRVKQAYMVYQGHPNLTTIRYNTNFFFVTFSSKRTHETCGRTHVFLGNLYPFTSISSTVL